MSDVTITPIGPAELLAWSADLAAIYQAAFGKADDRAARYRDEDIPAMADCEGFACVVAFMDARPVGFALGYDAVALPKWFRITMTAVAGTPVADWLPDAWYFADIAVQPEMQDQGLGTMLHDHLIALVPDRRKMLITFHGDHPAKRFYLRLGWREVVPDLLYRPGSPLTSLLEHVEITS